jgi:Stringent starvation protein B
VTETQTDPHPQRASRPRRAVIAGGIVILVASVVVLVRVGVLGMGEAWQAGKRMAQAKHKRVLFEEAMKRGWVLIHLDARRPGVKLPASFLGHSDFVLEYGHDMPRPIPDLSVTDEGIGATLSFDGQPHATHVPWTAVFSIGPRKGKSKWYREDTPPEVRARWEAAAR